jgi:16S rRNA (adenine(1408)-N(1))-methyltransferase
VGEIHVLMPWGSLLRGMIGGDEQVLPNLTAACAPGAEFLVTLNLHAWRPPVPEVGGLPEPTPESALNALAELYAKVGWRIESAEYLSDAEISALSTSWTRRLGSTRDQLAVLGLRGTI